MYQKIATSILEEHHSQSLMISEGLNIVGCNILKSWLVYFPQYNPNVIPILPHFLFHYPNTIKIGGDFIWTQAWLLFVHIHHEIAVLLCKIFLPGVCWICEILVCLEWFRVWEGCMGARSFREEPVSKPWLFYFNQSLKTLKREEASGFKATLEGVCRKAPAQDLCKVGGRKVLTNTEDYVTSILLPSPLFSARATSSRTCSRDISRASGPPLNWGPAFRTSPHNLLS